MRLGIGSYTFAWAIGVPGQLPPRPLSAWDLLEQARRLRVEVVQFCDNLPLAQLPKAELEAFERRVRESWLGDRVGHARAEHPKILGHTSTWRGASAASFCGWSSIPPGTSRVPEEAVARLRPLLAEFENAGVRLAIENHDRFPSSTLAWMIRQLGPERAGICLDTVNSFGALEGPEIVVQNLARTPCACTSKILTSAARRIRWVS